MWILWAVLLAIPLLLLLLYQALKAEFWVLFDGNPKDKTNPFRTYAR